MRFMKYTSPRQIIISFLFIICYFFTYASLAQNVKLENYTYIGEFSKEKAKLTLQDIPPLNTLNPTYTVNLYKIQYKTTAPNGSMTSASGLVAMPATPTKKISIVSFHHGTRVTRIDV